MHNTLYRLELTIAVIFYTDTEPVARSQKRSKLDFKRR